MPITFDTLDELKEFYLTFNLDAKRSSASYSSRQQNRQQGQQQQQQQQGQQEEKKRGRKPANKEQQPAPSSRRAIAEQPAPRRGRGPAASKAEKQPSKREKGETLTARIQNAIQNFLDKKSSFTANDIYEVLAKKDSSINKQSVITSVLKQMNGNFKNVSVKERPGMGPRPVKLYNAAEFKVSEPHYFGFS
jgi:hypothetical protein